MRRRLTPRPVVEASFDLYGYRCAIIFQPKGYRCGYVGVPKGHPYYGRGYHEVPIDCHGGLTYADSLLFGHPGNRLWWFGFDCCHAGDAPDLAALKLYYRGESLLLALASHMPSDGKVRSYGYVDVFVRHVARQLHDTEALSRLAPCPRCGCDTLDISKNHTVDGAIIWRIKCTQCFLSAYEESAYDAIKVWNWGTSNG